MPRSNLRGIYQATPNYSDHDDARTETHSADPGEASFVVSAPGELRQGPDRGLTSMHALLLALSFAVCAPLLAANRFVEAGAPAPDREWVARDYVDFAALIKATDHDKLPLLADREGREIIERATNPENLGLIRNKELPSLLRLQSAIEFSQGLNAVLMTYVSAANQGRKVNRELALLLCMTLRHAAAMLDVVDEFMAGLTADDPLKEQRAEGMRQIRSGLTTVLGGAETSLSERKFYAAGDFSLMLAAMAETLPRFITLLSPNALVEFRRKLEKHQTVFKDSTDARHLAEMIAVLRAASGAALKR